jgi:hypothetical protein
VLSWSHPPIETPDDPWSNDRTIQKSRTFKKLEEAKNDMTGKKERTPVKITRRRW